MTNRQLKISLVLLSVIACLLRFFALGQIPSGMTWDEAAIGYNGFAIVNTHRDEWLQKMPVSFRSFGDYKAPLAIYLNGIFTWLFGLNLWAIRLPFALAGLLTVIGGVLLVWLLLKNRLLRLPSLSVNTSLFLTAIFLTFSPWHLLFSRVGFESGLALAEVIWAANGFLLFLLLAKKQSKLSWLSLGLASLLAAASFYTYHSAKVTVPLLFTTSFILLLTQRRQITKLSLSLYPLSILILLLPLFKDIFFGSGLTRAGVTVFAIQPFFTAVLTSCRQFFLHLLPGFLLLGQTDSLRHSTGQMGVLLGTSFTFFYLGITRLLIGIVRFFQQKIKLNQLNFVGVIWLAAGLLPAAIGQEVPHPNRALLALPGFLLIILAGFDWFYGWLKRFNLHSRQIILASVLILHLSLFGIFLHDYFGNYQTRSSDDFLAGYLAVFDLIWQYHNGTNGKPQVEQIVMTNEYGQPYIFALLTGKINPIAYHNGALVKFLFVDQPTVGDLMRKNALVVTGPEVFNLDPKLAKENILDSAGKVRFRIFYSGETL